MATDSLITFLASIGAVFFLRLLYWTTQFVSLHFWSSSHPLKAYKRIDGETYALITGSSAGIGLGIARALVRQGFSVILLGHLPDELADAAQSLIASHNIPPSRVRTLVLDARTAAHEQILSTVDSISNLPISILVNNVGGIPMVRPRFKLLSSLILEEVDAHVDLNARFMARLTGVLLPVLKGQDRSLILNLSSPARIGLPWLVMYGATKAFNYAFSMALARELNNDPSTVHVDCLTVLPGDIHDQANDMARRGGLNSDEFGALVVGTVDTAVARRCVEVRPHGRNDLEVAVMEGAVPEWLAMYFATEELRDKKLSEKKGL